MKILSSTVFPKECIAYPNTLGLYATEERLGYTAYIFDSGFMHLVRYALSTDCISEFTDSQLKFFLEWIDYQVSLMNNSITYPSDSPVVAFDEELIKITECIPDPGQVTCGNSNLHTYNSCP